MMPKVEEDRVYTAKLLIAASISAVIVGLATHGPIGMSMIAAAGGASAIAGYMMLQLNSMPGFSHRRSFALA